MKFSKAVLFSLLALLAFAGCNSVDSRIKANAAVFNALDPETKQKIRNKTVEIGFTPDLVYMALGNPSEKSVKTTETGSTMVWSYQNAYDEYEGTAVHYQRAVVIDPVTGRRYVVRRPVATDIYSEQRDEFLRIEFKDGKVSGIEQNN